MLSRKDPEEKKSNDFSDVVRRIGATDSLRRGGFEIYVDPTDDPDIGGTALFVSKLRIELKHSTIEILMVRKKKSRAALDEVGWGSGSNLDEKTNAAKEKENLALKPKLDEKEKWWSIGRGRKDSKEKKDKGEREHSKARTKCKMKFH